MTLWPPDDIETRELEWTVDDLEVGDLVFGQRGAGPLARLCQIAGEPWRHVGSIVEGDSGLQIVEVLGDAFRLRSLASFFDPDRYVRWGAARLDVEPACIERANQWMSDRLAGADEQPQVYAWDDLILAGLIAATHRGLFARHPDRVRAAVEGAGRACKRALEYRDAPSLTCSAFIQLAYEAAGGPCVLEHRRWRGEPVSWPERSPHIDELATMTESELAGLDDLSLMDLYLEAERVDRGTSTTKARPGHLAEMLRVLAAGIAGYTVGTSPAESLSVDSRWVTPGDLWASGSVHVRANVTP